MSFYISKEQRHLAFSSTVRTFGRWRWKWCLLSRPFGVFSLAHVGPWPSFLWKWEKSHRVVFSPEAVMWTIVTVNDAACPCTFSFIQLIVLQSWSQLDLVQVLLATSVVKCSEPELDVAALVDHLHADGLGGRLRSSQLWIMTQYV